MKHDQGQAPYAEIALLHDLVTFEFAGEIGHQIPIGNGYNAVHMGEKTAITYDAGLFIKAFAVLAMVFHHCFCFNQWHINTYDYMRNGQLMEIAKYAQICIPLFAFLTGWTYYHHKDKSISYSIKKISVFIAEYWIVVIPICIFAALFCGYSFSSDTLWEFFPINEHPLMKFAWYVWFYIIMMLIFPLFNILEKRKQGIISIANFILILCCIFICSYSLERLYLKSICAWFPCAMCGYFTSKFKLLEFCIYKIKLKPICSILIISLIVYAMHVNCIVSSGFAIRIAAPFLILAILPLIYLCVGTRIQPIFLCIGRHSMNIWFIHCIFFSTITRSVVQSIFFTIDSSVWTFSVVLLISLAISFIIKPIQECAKKKITAAFFQK